MEWVKRKIINLFIAVLRACLQWLLADPDEKITRTPHTNTTDNSCSANTANTATSSTDDAFVESSTGLADRLYQDLSLLTPQTMASKAASYIDQGALQ